MTDLTIPQHSSTFMDRILTNDLLFDIIFDACSSASIIRISHTCRTAYAAVQSYMVLAFDVNVLLSRYFPDPLEFRTLQRSTGALISGSTALQFFLREHYPESDLDVYVRKEAHIEVARWVLAKGYRFTPSQHQDPDFEIAALNEDPSDEHFYDMMSGIFNVLTFVKPLENDPEKELKVQVIGATYTPMNAIFGFHSSMFFPMMRHSIVNLRVMTALVLNMIAWDYAYCLYPSATLDHRETAFLRYDTDDPRTDSVIEKYTARGFTILTDISEPSTLTKYGGMALRGVGDKRTWVFRLSTDGIASPKHEHALSRDPCVCTAWRLTSLPPQMRTNCLDRHRFELCYADCDNYILSLWQELNGLIPRDEKV